MVNRNLVKVIFTLFIFGAQSSYGGIPVVDGTNLAQNIVSALESVSQTTKQIQEYQTQLQQYERQLQNSLTPAAYIWDDAQKTIDDLIKATNTLNYYRNQLGSIDNYLDKFKDANFYKNSQCYSTNGCTAQEWNTSIQDIENSRAQAIESRQKATHAIFQGVKKQNDLIRNDARTLKRLQTGAQSARGQMEALAFANQFASNQSNQLLQIRVLLASQQNAMAAYYQAKAEQEARYESSSKKLNTFDLKPSPPSTWGW